MYTENELLSIIQHIKSKLNLSCPFCGSRGKILKGSENRGVCSESLCKRRFNIWKNEFSFYFYKKIKKVVILRVLELWMMCFKIKDISYVTGVSRISIWKFLVGLCKLLIRRR